MKIKALSKIEYETNRGFSTMYRFSNKIPLSLHILNNKRSDYIFGANPLYFILAGHNSRYNPNKSLNLELLRNVSMDSKRSRSISQLAFVPTCKGMRRYRIFDSNGIPISDYK